MNVHTAKTVERLGAYACAASICVMALFVDGIQAITLSIGVAGAIGAAGTYAAMRK